MDGKAVTEQINNFPHSNIKESKKNMLTSIIILTCNNLEYNKRCINSIRKYTKRGTFELIVVDNNSQDGTLVWLEKQQDVRIISNNINLGFPKGCNQGIKAASGDFVMLLNNDTVVTKNWLDNLITAISSSNDIAAVGADTNYCSYHPRIPVTYKNLKEMQSFAAEYNISNSDKWEYVIKLVGFCVLYKKEVFEKVGLLDEQFSPGNFDDDDMSLRVIKAGYKMLLCHDTFIHHYGSKSFGQDMSGFNLCYSTNHQKFIDKWLFDPFYALDKRVEMVSQIAIGKNDHIKVLEVGCACGTMLLNIKSKFKGAEIYGIEPNKAECEIAGAFANVKNCAYDEEEITYPQNFFDYIIFSDVLQKVTDPWILLSKYKNYLREDGHVLACIPNILHYSVISGLLCGRWSYAGNGILSKNNIRFFTPTEAEIMFQNAGFKNIKFSGTVLPDTPESINVINKLGELSSAQVKPLFSIYQLIVLASV